MGEEKEEEERPKKIDVKQYLIQTDFLREKIEQKQEEIAKNIQKKKKVKL